MVCVLVLFLIVPLKFVFLKSVHFLSHITAFENPHHHHGSGHTDHQHTFMEVIDHALDDFESGNAAPVELTSFKFMQHFPSGIVKLPDLIPVHRLSKHILLSEHIPHSPYLGIVLPPP
jgi:hypothetical protein